ncbi:MAG TPA: MBL fold metallo-hydrolase [Candidatus Limnocylindrales bacterium]|nr:MBL fold metallo-hydrolase [Candidatus Limnocylindrales bacterium]
MRLTVVGAGPAYSDDPGSIGACYLVQSGDRALALDLGHGAFAGLAARFPPERLETVAISHLHPDHCIDLVPLRHWLRYHVRPAARLRVDAPAELAARLDALHAAPGFTAAALDVVTLDPSIRRVGPFRLEARRVTHTEDSYAFRVDVGDAGPGLVYSGDVGAVADLQPLVRAGDTLLVEVSFGAGPIAPGASHLDGPTVGTLAAETRPRRVLLTHLLPGRDAEAAVRSVRDRWGGSVELVRPGFEVDV